MSDETRVAVGELIQTAYEQLDGEGDAEPYLLGVPEDHLYWFEGDFVEEIQS